MKKQYKYFFVPFLLVLLMYAIKVIEYALSIDFHYLGIYPKSFAGLKGVLFAPLIHGSFEHLYSNTFPFLLLSTAIIYFYPSVSYKVISFSWVLTGLGVWIGARHHWHIGASGLIYAFASFLFFAGIVNKSRRLIAISLLVSFLYGGILWGIFPQNETVSWESHLYGFISGIILAFFYGKHEFSSHPQKSQSKINDFSVYSSSQNIKFRYFYTEIDD